MYPKTVDENLRYRNQLFEVTHEASEDGKDYSPNARAAAEEAKELARRNILFFFNTYLWAEDPFADKGLRHDIPKIRLRPIVTYPFQDDFILWLQGLIERGEHGICDKSRDMLATYMVLGVYLHGWIFNKHKFLITSWKEDEIDGKEDTSTHFGKLRFWLRMMPWYMMPIGWDWKRNSSYMKLQNPENGGTLTGSSSSAALGSGRREDSIFYDEFSKWEINAEAAWTAGSDTTKTKIGVWTPRGSGNLAAELMRGAEIKEKRHLYWYLHPEKTFTSKEHSAHVSNGKVFDKVKKYVVQFHQDQSKAPSGCYIDQHGKVRSEWYDKECEGRKPEDIAENLDCDYLTTGRPIFDTLVCNQRLYESEEPKFIGDLLWKVRPVFDASSGMCINQEQLEVEFVKNMNGLYYIWEMPYDDKEQSWDNGYIIGADTAEGLEQHDYDYAEVLRRFGAKPEKAMRLHAHLKMHEYAEELAKMGVFYKRAYVNVERNNHGHGVLAHLVKFYNRLFHKAIFTKGYAEITDRIGHDTTGQSKGVIIGTLGKAISENLFTDRDEIFWKETLTFVDDDGKMEAQGKSRGEKCFDDCVMGKAITWWTHQNMPLPAMSRKVVPLTGWRMKQQMRANQNRVVGFVVQ